MENAFYVRSKLIICAKLYVALKRKLVPDRISIRISEHVPNSKYFFPVNQSNNNHAIGNVFGLAHMKNY